MRHGETLVQAMAGGFEHCAHTVEHNILDDGGSRGGFVHAGGALGLTDGRRMHALVVVAVGDEAEEIEKFLRSRLDNMPPGCSGGEVRVDRPSP